MSKLVAAIEQLREADEQLNASTPQPFPLPIGGLEAVVAGSVLALDDGDWWLPGLRERVGAVLREAPIERIIESLTESRPQPPPPRCGRFTRSGSPWRALMPALLCI